MNPTEDILAEAQRLAETSETWADLSNSLFDPIDGLVVKRFPDSEDRAAFRKSDTYETLHRLVECKMKQTGIAAGAVLIHRRIAITAILACSLFALVAHAEQPPQGKNPAAPAKGRLPITISKATTYITEPLRPDGYPDYLAALNQSASKGVTPENNAVVVLMQAFGPGVIEAKDREKFFKMLGIAPPPEKGDYFVDYATFVKEHAPEALKEQNDASGQWLGSRYCREWDRSGKRPWVRTECPLVAAWLAANEKPLMRVLKASKRSEFYLPLIARGNWLGTVKYFPCQLPIRDALRCLTRRALLRLQEGRTEQAWEDLQTCHRLARIHGWASASTSDCMIAVVCDQVACYGDRELAHFVKLTPEQSHKFCGDMAKVSPCPSLQKQLNLFERFLYLDAICATARGDLTPNDIVPTSFNADHNWFPGDNTPEWNALRESLAAWIRSGQVDWDEALRLGNAHFDRIAAIACSPTLLERYAAGGTLAKEMERQEAIYRYPRGRKTDNGGQVAHKDDAPRSFYTRGVFVVYMAQLVETVHTYPHSRAMIDSHLTPVALMLSAYRTEHGQYPDALHALTPKYLAAQPKDPWSNGDYRYRRQDDGYLLYSIGPNGKDDGGPRLYPRGVPVRENSDDVGVQVGGGIDEDK